MVGNDLKPLQMTTEEICQLSRRIIGYRPLDIRHQRLICTEPKNKRYTAEVKGMAAMTYMQLAFYEPKQVVSAAWVSAARGDKITVKQSSKGVWVVTFEGEPLADVGNAYFSHLLMLRPELDPLQAVKIRIELGVLKMGKRPKKRRTARLIVEQILRNARDALTAVKRFEPEIQKELEPLPYALMLEGVEALQKSVALKRAA